MRVGKPIHATFPDVSGEPAQSAIKALIGVPEGLRIFDMMVLGYGADEPIPIITASIFLRQEEFLRSQLKEET